MLESPIFISAVLGIVVGLVIFAISLLKATIPSGDRRFAYRYARKNYFMTRSEREFYNVLLPLVEHNYVVFAQVQLPTLLSHKIKGQHWQGALSHIDRKSVDFVICDKKFLSPQLVIELDDASHERFDRKLRDQEVEWIFDQAQIPLLRIPNHARFETQTLVQQLSQKNII
jgi:very-short-patch-repair endonuclease